MKKLTYLAITYILTLSACSNETVEINEDRQPILFNTITENNSKNLSRANMRTTGAITSPYELPCFGVMGYRVGKLNDINLIKREENLYVISRDEVTDDLCPVVINNANGYSWYYNNTKDITYWPQQDEIMFFAAYPPEITKDYDLFFSNGVGIYEKIKKNNKVTVRRPKLKSYTIESGEEHQKDLMFAYPVVQNALKNNGVVQLNFYHYLSQLRFFIHTKSTINVDLKEMWLCNIASHGKTSKKEPFFWDIDEDPSDFSDFKIYVKQGVYHTNDIGEKNTANNKEPIFIKGEELLIIPQPMVGKEVPSPYPLIKYFSDKQKFAYLKIRCNITDVNSNEPIVTDDEWMYMPFTLYAYPQTMYNITLNFGGGYNDKGQELGVPMTFTIEEEEWGPIVKEAQL